MSFVGSHQDIYSMDDYLIPYVYEMNLHHKTSTIRSIVTSLNTSLPNYPLPISVSTFHSITTSLHQKS